MLSLVLFFFIGSISLFFLLKSDKILIASTIYVFIIDSGNGLFPLPLRELVFAILLAKTLFVFIRNRRKFPYFIPFLLISIVLPLFGSINSLARGTYPSFVFDDAKGYVFLLTGLCLGFLVYINNELKKLIINHFLIATLIVSITTIVILMLELSGIQGIYKSSEWLIAHNLGFAGLEINGQFRVFIRSQLYVMLSLILVFSMIINGKHKIRNYILLLIYFITIVICNTRGLWLGSILGLTIIFFYSKFNFKKIIFVYIAVFISIYLGLTQQDFISKTFDRLGSSLDFSSNESNFIRAEQANQLLYEFQNHFVFGKGFGSPLSTGYVRAEIPYTFELSYYELLYKLGIAGFSLFVIGLVFLLVYIMKVKNKPLQRGLFASYMSFILLSTTNPYIVSSLGMFFLSIVFALSINEESQFINSTN